MFNKQLFGWSMYDFANTAFSALFITFFFPVLISVYLNGNEFHIGLAMGLSMFLAGIFVPFLGAVSDAIGKRKIFVLIFTLICVILTSIVAYSSLFWALILGALAAFSFHAALDVYDAMLFNISTSKNIARVSGYGVALGYIGTVLSLIMAFLIFNYFGWESKQAVQAIFPATAIFYILFSIPFFILVKEKTSRITKPIFFYIKIALQQLIFTFKNIRKQSSLWFFLLASFLYTDGMNTAIIFLYLYGRETLSITIKQFFPIFALMAIASSLGALLFGKLGDRFSHKKTLIAILYIWIAIILLLIIKTNLLNYIVAGIIGGATLGGAWTLTRPMLVDLAPKHKLAELFGFQGLTEKFSGVVGPILFGYLVVKFDYFVGLSSLLVFFVLGLVLLSKVKK